jgi:hypothetical protein
MLLFVSCESNTVNKKEKYSREYLLIKSDDNNWTHSAEILCDSVNMITNQHVEYWIDGHHFNLKGQLIKIFSTERLK